MMLDMSRGRERERESVCVCEGYFRITALMSKRRQKCKN